MRIEIEAPAKINLSLEVVGKRPDGYHDLVSIMQTVSVTDSLTMWPAPSLSFSCSNPDLSGDDNLVLKAARLVRGRFQIEAGCRMHLEKQIPEAAGLGGGSSDAAAALSGVCRLWNLRPSCREMIALAEQLGSDVPFFLYGRTALVEGRGEQVAPLPAPQIAHYLLVTPPLKVRTADIFSAVSTSEWTDGSRTRELAGDLAVGGRVNLGINDLQAALFRLYPQVRACYDAMCRATGGRAMVSGSGPTVVGVFTSTREALAAAKTAEAGGNWARAATPYSGHGGDMPCP